MVHTTTKSPTKTRKKWNDFYCCKKRYILVLFLHTCNGFGAANNGIKFSRAKLDTFCCFLLFGLFWKWTIFTLFRIDDVQKSMYILCCLKMHCFHFTVGEISQKSLKIFKINNYILPEMRFFYFISKMRLFLGIFWHFLKGI